MSVRTHGSKIGTGHLPRRGSRRASALRGSVLTARQALVCGCIVNLLLLLATGSSRWIWGRRPAVTDLPRGGSAHLLVVQERVLPPTQAVARILKVGGVAWRVAKVGGRTTESRLPLRPDTAGFTHGLTRTLVGIPGATDAEAVGPGE